MRIKHPIVEVENEGSRPLPFSDCISGDRLVRRSGMAAVMAMLFLVIFTTLTLAMFSMATTNVQSASNLSQVDRARALAESGLRWQTYRFLYAVSRPRTTKGDITADYLESSGMWLQIRDAVDDDWSSLASPGVGEISTTATSITMAGLSIDGSAGTFAIQVEQLPSYTTDPSAENYRRWIRVTSTGRFGDAVRSAFMDFVVDKKIKFAIVGRTAIQLGRNTVVEGPVGLSRKHYPPLFALSDFSHLTPALTSRIGAFQTLARSRHAGLDNRISLNNTSEYEYFETAGYVDRNGDNYVDEYDLFLDEFDADEDKTVTRAEFTNASTNKLYDENLFKAIDSLGGPMYDGDTVRQGLEDDQIDNYDVYAKIGGQVNLAPTQSDWSSNPKNGVTISNAINGPVIWNDPTTPAVRLDAGSEVPTILPSDFDTSGFKTRTGSSNGTPAKSGSIWTNWNVTSADTTETSGPEGTPLGSVSRQATYRRPVFRNVTFRNCRIPRGLNALFVGCRFEGTTFIELRTDITLSGSPVTTQTQGMSWAKRKLKTGANFSSTTALTSTNSDTFNEGNNIRFDGCTFKGPLASDIPPAYTHFANSWEFTGATTFDNQADDTATIVAPQTNIEMGSFTNPTAAPSTLVGVVVAGNIDIRGTSIVDGTLINTGDGAGNMTLGWFGTSDSETDPTSMPEGGYGRLNIRYNPYRALPDGINLPIDILPDSQSYTEGN